MEGIQRKVLNILTVRFAANGIAAFVMNYGQNLPIKEAIVDYAAPNLPQPETLQRIEEKGGRVFALPMRNRNPLAYIRALAKLIQDNGYDVVHVHGNSATMYVDLLAAKRGGAKVRIAHSHNTTCKMKLADKLLRPAFYHSYTHAMACGQAAGEWLFPHRPFAIVQNAVDTAAFAFDPAKRAHVRKELGLIHQPVVCHVGTFNAQKNHCFLLTVFVKLKELLPNARLLLLGEGPLMEAAKEQAAKLGLTQQVIFAGAVASAGPYLCAADAFLLPSLYEGLPFTLIEAQCAGLPCLVSDRVTREAAFCFGTEASNQDISDKEAPNGDTADNDRAPVGGGEVKFLSIDGELAAAQWAQGAKDVLEKPMSDDQRAVTSQRACQAGAKAAFSIVENAKELAKLYQGFCREAGI